MRIVFRLIVLLFLAILNSTSFAQLDTLHYLPPMHARDNILAGNHFIYLSTPVVTPFTVTLEDGAGNFVASAVISQGNPERVFIGDGQVPGTELMVPVDSVGMVLQASGIIATAPEEFYCNFRHEVDEIQGTSVTAKGNAAFGQLFYVGSMPQQANHGYRSFLATIMAREDGTSVTVSGYDSEVVFKGGLGDITSDVLTIELDAGESYVMTGYTNVVPNWVGFVGAKIESDKDIVLTNGNFCGSISAGSGQDIGLDQSVPTSLLGKEYILIRGNGSDGMERPLVIGVHDNTEIFVNDVVAPIGTIDEGEYFLVPSFYYDGSLHKNMRVRTSRAAYMYQPLGGSTYEATPGLNFIPPVSCFLPNEVDLVPDVDSIGEVDFDGAVTLFTIAGSTVLINDAPIPAAAGPEPVTGLPGWETYFIDGLVGDAKITSTNSMAAGYFGYSGAAGMAGYFSGFGSTPGSAILSGSCAPGIVLDIGEGYDAWQWYMDGEIIDGATSSTLDIDVPGYYSVAVTAGVCTDTTGDFFIPACATDGGLGKNVENITEVAPDVYEIDYAITVQNYGPHKMYNVQVMDSLIGLGCETVTVITPPYLVGGGGILSPGAPNPDFEPGLDNRLLLGTDTLANGAVDTLKYTIQIDVSADGCEGAFSNQAYLVCTSIGPTDGTEVGYVTDSSVDGDNPDPNMDGLPNETSPTVICLPNVPTTVTYAETEFEITDASILPVVEGWTDGTFGVTPVGLTIDTETGEIDPSTSLPGDYSVTYYFGTEPCLDSATILITILEPVVEIDSDGDGIFDSADLDDDNDGIPDLEEDLNEDGDGDPNTNPSDTDGDGIPDIFDLDSDNDGIPDIIEAGGTDEDGDGQIDDLNDDGTLINDTDGDGLDDFYDADNGGTDIPNPDSDGDGNPDFQDLDSDNDGIFDLVEDGGTDDNNDGLVDEWLDPDGDGWDDSNGLNGDQDQDGDGIPDYVDLDSDNDGIFDIVEDGGSDTDGNGTIDDFNDVDGDGADDDDMTNGLQDTDGDGVADHEDLDSDNDGIPDLIEDGGTDADGNGTIDDFNDGNGDGADDDDMTDGLDDFDGDGVPDHEDLDSDNDGITDANENGVPDANGDGVIDDFTDANGDGWDDDNQITDPIDTDDDGEPDYTDLDSDNDGILDIIEGAGTDVNNDGVIDDFEDSNGDGLDDDGGLSPPDTDGDGTPDFQDLDSDNDGISDAEENDPDGDGSGPDDTDGDDIPDYQDVDDDGDAILTADESTKDSDGNYLDCDNDGIPNFLDSDPCLVDIPTGFSPNEDGVNDYFVISGIENNENVSLTIFNRWGSTVYQTDSYKNDWDGTNNLGITTGPRDLPVGTYFYIVDLGDGSEIIKNYLQLQR